MKLTRLALLISLSLGISHQQSAIAADGSAYYRFPSVRAGNVVFTAEGDIWKVGINGGQAQRLTSHPGTELYPTISQDGQWLAFSAVYEGATEAYVMPINGGLPKRISFENDVVNVLGWTARGEVLISTQNSTGPGAHRIIAAIDPKTMVRRMFPVADANEAALDDSGRYLYFTRFGLQMTNDNAKHYRGGANAQLWRYDLEGKAEAINLFPQDKSNNKRPMWWQGRLYFMSDRDGTFNIWSANPDGSAAQALTHQQEWEVRNAALGDGKITYQLGADLHLLDLRDQSDKTLNINLVSDFDQERQHLIKNPLEYLTYSDLSGKGDRLLLTARGHVTNVGLGKQRRIDLPIPADARARSAVFSADQKSVYAIVDTTGENEIWKFPANGIGKPEVLTTDGTVHRFNLFPSPDGKWLAHTDKRGRLWLLDLATKTNQLIDNAGKIGVPEFDNIVWSPDSQTIAVTRPNTDVQRTQIGLYSLADKQMRFVTSDHYESRSPVFSGDGHWLYFLSDRSFKVGNNAPWGDRNLGPGFDKRTGVYAIALQAKLRFPYKAVDELHVPPVPEKVEANKAEAASKEKTTKPGLPTIEYQGLAQRLYQVPLAAGNYRNLAIDDKRLYFIEQEANEEKGELKTLAISNTSPKPDVFASGVRDFNLSNDKKHVFYRTATPAGAGNGDFIIVDAGAKAPGDISQAKVSINDWSFIVDPRQEWREMFGDAWRMHRDYFYDDKMRGTDWNAIRSKYAPLVDRVSDRAELNDVLAQMASEVGALHSQFRPGDIRKAPPEGTPASLGAVLTRSAEGVMIEHIYRTETELPNEHGPLAQTDLDVKEGDQILSVNGHPTKTARDISDLLINQADKQVLLQIKRDKQAPHEVIVTPVSMKKHADLRYSDWEQSRSERVSQASKGKIGYLHLRAMGPDDINSFARDFYSNINRDGLIIDVRRNRGGNIDSWIIEKLLRKAWAFWSNPSSAPSTNMQQTFRGHLVVLVDELTYSDGETFAAGIKALKLAPLVGKRTAGAGVWLSDNNSLTDNGMIRAAENAQFSVDGHWLVEGVGVTPDIEVDNLPHATFKGQDQQLETAIRILQEKLQSEPVKPLIPHAFPPLK
ncbi:S41 family peptidase [Undibacterium sp. SXout11W]|uniref:S41 family peptidase n=1 Tax=Undibacterium sp. SXout11W TaxID=3413050 RepID=UPI003BEFF553